MLKKRHKTLDSQFLIRVIKNEVGAEEKEYFHAWLSESDQNKEEFGDLVQIWDLAENFKVPFSSDQEQQWNLIQEKIQTSPPYTDILTKTLREPPPQQNKIRSEEEQFYRKDNSWILKIAAVLVITIALAILIKLNNLTTQEQSISNYKQTSTGYYEISTEKGERKTFRLADGTIIYLNSDSKLMYPKIFSEFSREVEVIGEAYFAVVPEKERVFKVVSGKTVTIVTGTEFNIKYRNNKVSVVVAKGSVRTCLKNSMGGNNLKKGKMISFTESKGFSKPISVNLKHFLAWRQDKFSFVHSSLKDVMAEIERYYNIPVVFQNDSTKNKIFTGRFDTDSLERIFSVISLTLDVKIDYKGRKVIIH